MEEVTRRENEHEPDGGSPGRAVNVELREPPKEKSCGDRREGGDGKCAQKIVAEGQREQTNDPWKEREEDDPVSLVALSHVAVARDVEVMRSVPLIPDGEPAVESHKRLVLEDRVSYAPEE